MAQLYANNAKSSLASLVSDVATTLPLQTGEGALFPSPTGGDFFLVTLYEVVAQVEQNHEIVKCTARSGDSLTVVRAQESTTAQEWAANTPVELRITKGVMEALDGAITDGDFSSNGLMKRTAAGTYGTAVADTDYQSVLSEGAFVAGDKTKLDGIESGADVTDTTNVDAAGAIMDGDFSSNGLMKRTAAGTYATAVADTDYQSVPAEGAFVAGDKTKLDGIEAGADVTDTTNVTAAGALMDSEVDANLKTFALPASTTISAYGATVVAVANEAAFKALVNLEIGTDVQAYDADTAKTDVAQSFTAAQRSSITTLTDGATITPNMNDNNDFEVTLGGNRTLANPTNLTEGQCGSIKINQDGTGSRTLAYGSYWNFEGGTAPILSTTASSVDVLHYKVWSSTFIEARLAANYS